MKIRLDYVSNSSSSSFIVLHKDNKYGLLLREDVVEHLTLHDYLKRFGEQDMFGYLTYSDEKMRFLTDSEFIDAFTKSIGKYLPISCKSLWSEIEEIESRRKKLHADNPDLTFDDDRLMKLYEDEEKTYKKILNIVENILKDKFGNETFDYADISDNDYANFENDIDGCYSEEDATIKRIEMMREKDPSIEFYRYINNH